MIDNDLHFWWGFPHLWVCRRSNWIYPVSLWTYRSHKPNSQPLSTNSFPPTQLSYINYKTISIVNCVGEITLHVFTCFIVSLWKLFIVLDRPLILQKNPSSVPFSLKQIQRFGGFPLAPGLSTKPQLFGGRPPRRQRRTAPSHWSRTTPRRQSRESHS